MTLKPLAAKYGGPNAKGRELFNRAIRAELVGGDDLLDAMDLVDRLARRLRERDLAGKSEAQQAMDALIRCRQIFADVIGSRYPVD